VTESRFDPTNISPDFQQLTTVQDALVGTGNNVQLGPDFYDHQRTQEAMTMQPSPDFGERHRPLGRTKELWAGQSREPLRPFVELIANACDSVVRVKQKEYGYQLPRVEVRVTARKDGGYTILISDKGKVTGQHGEGMAVEYFSKIMKPFATGNEGNSETVGMMGVGAQQRLNLLRNSADKIFVSSSTSQGILVSKEQLASDGENIDLRYGGVENEHTKQLGTSFVIQLSAETAGEIGLTIPALSNYLKAKFGGSFDKDIALSSIDQTTKLAQKTVETVTPIESQFRRLNLNNDQTIQLAFSKEKTTIEAPICQVYLDVLGVSYGEPLEISRPGFPKIIRLNMNQKIATITESRGKFGLTRLVVESVINAVRRFSQQFQTDTKTKVQLFDALCPLFSRFADLRSLPVALRTDPTLNVSQTIKQSYLTVLAQASENLIVPSELADVYGDAEGVIIVTDERVPSEYSYKLENWPNTSLVEEMRVNGKPVVVVDLPAGEQFRLVADRLFVSRESFHGLLSRDKAERRGCAIKLVAVLENHIDANPERKLTISYLLKTVEEKKVDRQTATTTPSDEELNDRHYYANLALKEELRQRDISLCSRVELLDLIQRAFEIYNDNGKCYFLPGKNMMGEPLKAGRINAYDAPDYTLRLIVSLLAREGSSYFFGIVITNLHPFYLDSTNCAILMQVAQQVPFLFKLSWLNHPPNMSWVQSVLEGRHQSFENYMSSNLGSEWRSEFPQIVTLADMTNSYGHYSYALEVFLNDKTLLSQWQVYSRNIFYSICELGLDSEKQAKKVLYNLPILMQVQGVQVNHEKLVLFGYYLNGQRQHQTAKLTQEEVKAFDKIIAWMNDDTEVEVRQPTEDVADQGEPINPASLWILHQTQQLDMSRSIAEQTDFEPDREALRALLHPINRLQSDPGTSFAEVVKNALDALSRDSTAKRQVRVTDYQVLDQQTKGWKYCVEVQDWVGIDPQEALVKLTLPQVGEGIHGLGFLKLLAEFDEIRVTTSNGVNTGEIVYTPIRSDDGQDTVVDFTVRYRELETTRRGTKVKLTKKSTSPSVDAAIFRGSLHDFARQIPESAGQMYLNDQGEPLNTALKTVARFNHSELGQVELTIRKEGAVEARSSPQVTVQRVEVRDFNLSSLIRSRLRSLPPVQIELLATSDFSLTFDGVKTTTIRDGSGFANDHLVTPRIAQLIHNEADVIIAGLAAEGALSCQNYLTTNFSPRLYDSPKEFVDKERELRTLAGGDENMQKMIDVVYTLPWKGDDGRSYPSLLAWLLTQEKQRESSSTTSADEVKKVNYWEDIPHIVRRPLLYFHGVFAPDRFFSFDGAEGSIPIYLTNKPGSRAFYRPRYGTLHYSTEVLEELTSSDPRTQARGIKTIAHELQHVQEHTEEGLIHPPEFYTKVESKLLAIEDRMYAR